MRKQPIVRLGVSLFVFALSACAGNHVISALPSGVNNPSVVAGEAQRGIPASPVASTTGTLVVTLPPIVAPSPLPSPGILLSSGTRSVGGRFGKYAIAPIVLGSATPGCAEAMYGLVCTLHLKVPSGAGSFQLLTFGDAKGKGLPLAMSVPIVLRVVPGVDTYPHSLSFKSIVRGLRVTVSPPEVTVTIGKNERTSVLTAYETDASGALAQGDAVLSDGTYPKVKLAQTGFQTSTMPLMSSTQNVLVFNGQKTGKLTFTASQKGKSVVLAPASATLIVRAKPGVSGLGATIVASGSDVPEFSTGATGSATPLRTLFGLHVGSPYGADAQGNFWMNNARYSNTGTLLGSIALQPEHVFAATTTDASGNVFAILSYEDPGFGYCNYPQWIAEYAAGDYSGHTIRKIPYPSGCLATAIAVDSSGFIYTYTPAGPYYQPPTISKWPANASGNVSPLSTRSVPSLSSMASDASGNNYAVEQAQEGSPVGTFVKFVPGSSTPQTVLPGVSVAGFTMDASGNTYAEVPRSTTSFQIEEFALGSTTPSNTLSSSSLTTPMGIAVVP